MRGKLPVSGAEPIAAIPESSVAIATLNTAATVSGCPKITGGALDASLRGMPLQKSDAICISAKPRARYISPTLDVSAGWYFTR